MTEILMKNNFVYDDEDKSWGRGNWTIRFYKNMVEIFNTPDVEGGKYYCSNIYKIDLQTVIDDIDNN